MNCDVMISRLIDVDEHLVSAEFRAGLDHGRVDALNGLPANGASLEAAGEYGKGYRQGYLHPRLEEELILIGARLGLASSVPRIVRRGSRSWRGAPGAGARLQLDLASEPTSAHSGISSIILWANAADGARDRRICCGISMSY